MNVVNPNIYVSRREQIARLHEARWSHARIAVGLGISLKLVQNEVARCRKKGRLPPAARNVRLVVAGAQYQVFKAAAAARGETVVDFFAALLVAAAECPDAIRDDGVLTPKRKRA